MLGFATPDTRRDALIDWLKHELAMVVHDLEPASADASFRRYFRVWSSGTTWIAMDAPPPRENVRPFLSVAKLLRRAGVQAPRIHAAEPKRGFLLLDDLGNQNYLDALDADSANGLYQDALATLLRLQTCVDASAAALPRYGESLLSSELELFREWFLDALIESTLDSREMEVWEGVRQSLVASALEQPTVFVHRDFHSRNLMVTEQESPGVLDFQDAVVGPITYDLVSLLRDCYIAWPAARVAEWREGYRDRLEAAGLLESDRGPEFRRWFDWMGMQRHLKAIGIFSRLKLRDGKAGYLKDIPRTLAYVTQVASEYTEFSQFSDFLEARVKPRLALVLGA